MNQKKNAILEKFKEISKRFFSMQKELITSLKINSGEYKILTVLSLNENLTQTTLGETCGIDKPATSRLLLKLHLQGLISKNYKDGNKKNVYIDLTEKGKEKAKIIGEELCKLKSKYFCELNEKDSTTFLKLLDKALKKEAQNA